VNLLVPPLIVERLESIVQPVHLSPKRDPAGQPNVDPAACAIGQGVVGCKGDIRGNPTNRRMHVGVAQEEMGKRRCSSASDRDLRPKQKSVNLGVVAAPGAPRIISWIVTGEVSDDAVSVVDLEGR